MLLKLIEGKLKLHELEKHLPAKQARKVRLEYIEHLTEQNYPELSDTSLNADKLINKNIEDLIGGIEIPLGIAGPISIKSSQVTGSFMLPMATTEGALVASTSRGAKVLTQAGGVNIEMENFGITRAPVFRTKDLSQAMQLKHWVIENLANLKEVAESTSNHLKLLGIKPFVFGSNIWLRINYDTDQAMGMNMATIASSEIAKYICAQHKYVELLAVSGNMCVDKKANTLNIHTGRGRQVHAQVIIPKSIVEESLHTTIEKIVEVVQTKTWIGSALSGSISFNSHIANVIAATFAATGQDLAHIVDSSTGFFNCRAIKNTDLEVSIFLPSLLIGTIGGGTSIPKQHAALKLMTTDIDSKQSFLNADTVAQVLAAGVLAAELSVHAALAADELTKAHQKLGRNK